MAAQTSVSTKRNFDAALKAFEKANKEAVTCARECTHLAIDHLYEHGDTTYLQRFLVSLETHKNWNRVSAYKSWLMAFTPCEMTNNNGKLTLPLRLNDERKTALWPNKETKTKLLETAKSQSFWDFAPEKEAVPFVFSDMLKRIESMIEQAKHGSRFTRESVEANIERLNQLDRLVAAVKAGTIASLLPHPENVDQTGQQDQRVEKLVRNGQTVSEVPVDVPGLQQVAA